MCVKANVPFDVFVSEIWEYDKRAKWDPQMQGGRMLKSKSIEFTLNDVLDSSFNNDYENKVTANMTRYNTNSALGGIVKPRVFTDAVVTVIPKIKEAKQTIM